MTLLPPIFLAMLAWSCDLSAATPDKTRQLLADGKEPVRIVCLGDSITGVYYHTGGVRAYPEMLEIALRKAFPHARVTVRNAGISGDTTKGGLARLDRDVLAHNPHLVTVMFGMNDMARIPLADFRRNLREIIARCRKAGAEVLLCTQNSVVDTPARPGGKLEVFTQAIRDMGSEESLSVVDCHAIYEAVRARDDQEWSLLLSDAIHPNMDGHKLFASAIAQVIAGEAVSLKDIGPPQPAMPHTAALLKEGKPVKVLAMPPFDQFIGPALTRLYPDAKITVIPWLTEGQTLAQLEAAAQKVRAMAQDLVLIAVPKNAAASNPQEFHAHYSWIMNWSLSFGPQQWDVLVVPPAPGSPESTATERLHETLARRLIIAQDLNMIDRPPGDETPIAEFLPKWLAGHLQTQSK